MKAFMLTMYTLRITRTLVRIGDKAAEASHFERLAQAEQCFVGRKGPKTRAADSGASSCLLPHSLILGCERLKGFVSRVQSEAKADPTLQKGP